MEKLLSFVVCLLVASAASAPDNAPPEAANVLKGSPYAYANPWGIQNNPWEPQNNPWGPVNIVWGPVNGPMRPFNSPWAPQNNPWIPPWVAASMPKWAPCDASATLGSSCLDCNTRRICTKFGQGLVKGCTDPSLPHCDLGSCVATPGVQCAAAAPSTPTAAAPEQVQVAEIPSLEAP